MEIKISLPVRVMGSAAFLVRPRLTESDLQLLWQVELRPPPMRELERRNTRNKIKTIRLRTPSQTGQRGR